MCCPRPCLPHANGACSLTTHAALLIQVLHVPMHIAPISIFVNIPTSVLPKQDLRLSACTIAGIFQARHWAGLCYHRLYAPLAVPLSTGRLALLAPPPASLANM